MEIKQEVQNDSTSQPTAEEKLSREIWLNYFNSYLYSRGLISETEMRKMRRMISK